MEKGVRRVAWAVAAIVAIVHLAVIERYGLFANELYFIVCGRHPAFGYVDQPPLVPFLAAASQTAGTHAWLLRLPAVLAAVLLVPLTVEFARLLGAGVRGAWLAAIAAATPPTIVALSATLTTSTFEPLDFTAIAYLVTRALVLGESRAWWIAGTVAGLAFETKYGVMIWLIGLVVGLAVAGPRSAFRSRDFWIGVAIAATLALPNALWQIANGLPFLQLVRNDSAGNLTGTPLVYVLDQVVALNFVLAPLWIAGAIAPFASARFARFRFLSIAFVAAAIIVYATHGKSYYLAGAFPSAFALGAAACSALPRAAIALWSVFATANAALYLPLVLPLESPRHLAVLTARAHIRAVETAVIGAPLPPTFSYEFGWDELASGVEHAYAALPPAQRAKAAVYASNYVEASALDVFGEGLPPALSGNNQYYLWGPRGYDGSVVIAVGIDPARWSGWCESLRVVAHFGSSPFVMPRERDRPIAICLGLHPPLAQRWPRLKYFGI